MMVHRTVPATIPGFVDRPVRKPECRKATGLSDTTLWRLEKAGKFPKRFRLHGNIAAWWLSDIVAWQQNLRGK